VSTSPLAVIVDGTPLSEEDARALWARFSAHMDAHKGDLVGFAQTEGFASVHPESRRGQAVLVASRSAAQRPYGAEAERSGSHSGKRRR
jgi:hypothetical protein